MIASPERAALEVLAPSVYSYVTSDGNTQRANTGLLALRKRSNAE